MQDIEDGTPKLVRGTLRRYGRILPAHGHCVDRTALDVSSPSFEAGGMNEGEPGAGAARRSTVSPCLRQTYSLPPAHSLTHSPCVPASLPPCLRHGNPPSPRLVPAERQSVRPNVIGAKNTLLRSKGPVGRVTCHGNPPSPRLVPAERQPVGPNETGAKNILDTLTSPNVQSRFL